MHEAVIDYLRDTLQRTGLDKAPVRVLDIGGRHTPTRYYDGVQPRELFQRAQEYLVLDITRGPDVDIIADATDLSEYQRILLDLQDFDVVVCTEVLEHVKDWPTILDTAYRVLAKDGRLILTCAGPGRRPHPATTDELDPPPGEFYANVAPQELSKALAHVGFRDIIAFQIGTDTQATAVK